jgi:hypothetical protein
MILQGYGIGSIATDGLDFNDASTYSCCTRGRYLSFSTEIERIFPVMYHLTWQDVDPEIVPRMLAEIGKSIQNFPFDGATAIVREHSLPFYADYKLYEIKDATKPDLEPLLVLYTAGGTPAPLNWTNFPIYTTNEKAPIIVNAQIAPAYVKFFFDFVRGRHGRFLIVENAREINWKEAPPEKGIEALNKMITPVAIYQEKPDGGVSMSAYMIFKDSLFKANVHVEKNGLVSLSDEQLVVESMPIHEDPSME